MARSPNRLVALIVGAGFLLIGILGLILTAGQGFLSPQGGPLLGVLQVNGLQSVVHVLLGAALLLAALSNTAAAKTVNGTAGIATLLLGLVGLFLVGSEVNVLALTVTDNVLHFAAAVVLLAVALGADKAAATA